MKIDFDIGTLRLDTVSLARHMWCDTKQRLSFLSKVRQRCIYFIICKRRILHFFVQFVDVLFRVRGGYKLAGAVRALLVLPRHSIWLQGLLFIFIRFFSSSDRTPSAATAKF